MDELPCDRIIRCQFDYYQVLALTESEANEMELVKKRYYQLAKDVHPDKCTHPLANDAFKGMKGIS
jgi:DnaJ-class molecular chaperone